MPVPRKPIKRAETSRMRETARRTAARSAARGRMRVCEAPNCGQKFEAYVARQRFCSDACRARAFYWDYKNETGERYAARRQSGRRSASAARAARRSRSSARGASRTRAASRSSSGARGASR